MCGWAAGVSRAAVRRFLRSTPRLSEKAGAMRCDHLQTSDDPGRGARGVCLRESEASDPCENRPHIGRLWASLCKTCARPEHNILGSGVELPRAAAPKN